MFDPAEHDSFVAAFEATLSKYGHITAVIGAFVPQPAAPGAIYGTDQTALRTALDPSVRLTKVALHYARRQKGGLTIVWLALTGKYSLTDYLPFVPFRLLTRQAPMSWSRRRAEPLRACSAP